MEFRKKLKTRLYLAISYMIIGVALIVVSNVVKNSNPFLNYYGIALAVVGVARLKQYFVTTRSDETIKAREIAETDERNISISTRAKSLSFVIYILAASVGVIVLQLLEMTNVAFYLGWSVIAMIAIYWMCYFIVRKKS